MLSKQNIFLFLESVILAKKYVEHRNLFIFLFKFHFILELSKREWQMEAVPTIFTKCRDIT